MKNNKIIKKIFLNIDTNFRLGFIYTFAFGLLVHLYMMTNKLPNHDDIHQLFFNMDLRISGRWFLQYAGTISSYFSMPWVNGILILFYISLSTSLIVGILEIKSKIFILIISGIMISFTGVVAVFVYMNSADAYFLALFMSVLGAYLYLKMSKGFVFFILLNILSLATYQIYFGISISLIFIYYIFRYINNEIEEKSLFKNLFLLLFNSLIVLIGYVISVKYIFTVQLTSYQGLDKMGQIDYKNLPKLITKQYEELNNFFINDEFSQFGWMQNFNKIFSIISIALVFYHVFSTKKSLKGKIISIILILLLPVSINLLYILNNGEHAGLRMLYPYVLVYIVILKVVYDAKENFALSKVYTGIKYFIFIMSLLSIYQFSIVTNKVYLTLDIDQRNLQAYTNRVINKIEEVEGYDTEKEIVYIGYPIIKNEFTNEYFTDDVKASTLLKNKIPSTIHWVLYHERYMAFPNNIKTFDELDINKLEDEALKDKIKNSKTYPKKSSIFEYNNKIYVKFSNFN